MKNKRITNPTSNESHNRSLFSVDRAVFELKKGRFVTIISDNDPPILIKAAEGITPFCIGKLKKLSKRRPLIAFTKERAKVFGFDAPEAEVLELRPKTPLTAKKIRSLTDPLANDKINSSDFDRSRAGNGVIAAIKLTKIALLLPTVVFSPLEHLRTENIKKWADAKDILSVNAPDIFSYQVVSAESLQLIGEASVPIKDAKKSKVLAFQALDGNLEHLAIVIGEIDNKKPVLTRIHSECFTGDLIGSLRCDCGDQLRGAIRKIAKLGSGVLLYLRQEGRGIGLSNKLKAYSLQDKGHNTYNANQILGFYADERIYSPAAQILKLLKISCIRLMTNNPEKINALTSLNIKIAERVPLTFKMNEHNERYIKTKKAKGHKVK